MKTLDKETRIAEVPLFPLFFHFGRNQLIRWISPSFRFTAIKKMKLILLSTILLFITLVDFISGFQNFHLPFRAPFRIVTNVKKSPSSTTNAVETSQETQPLTEKIDEAQQRQHLFHQYNLSQRVPFIYTDSPEWLYSRAAVQEYVKRRRSNDDPHFTSHDSNFGEITRFDPIMMEILHEMKEAAIEPNSFFAIDYVPMEFLNYFTTDIDGPEGDPDNQRMTFFLDLNAYREDCFQNVLNNHTLPDSQKLQQIQSILNQDLSQVVYNSGYCLTEEDIFERPRAMVGLEQNKDMRLRLDGVVHDEVTEESDSDRDSDSDSDTDSDTDSESESDSDTESDSDSESDSETDSDSYSDSDEDSDSTTDTDTDTDTDSDMDTSTSGSESDSESTTDYSEDEDEYSGTTTDEESDTTDSGTDSDEDEGGEEDSDIEMEITEIDDDAQPRRERKGKETKTDSTKQEKEGKKKEQQKEESSTDDDDTYSDSDNELGEDEEYSDNDSYSDIDGEYSDMDDDDLYIGDDKETKDNENNNENNDHQESGDDKDEENNDKKSNNEKKIEITHNDKE
jgi:hypothetical protein